MSDKSPGYDPGKILDSEGLTDNPLDLGEVSDEYTIDTNTKKKSLVEHSSLGKTTGEASATGQHPLGGDLRESEGSSHLPETGVKPSSLVSDQLSELDHNFLAGESESQASPMVKGRKSLDPRGVLPTSSKTPSSAPVTGIARAENSSNMAPRERPA